MTAAQATQAPTDVLGVDHTNLDLLADLVADRVVARLQARPALTEPAVWTTARVAAELGRSEEWVRDHRHELGVLPAAGVRPRLMFDAGAVRSWATARDGREQSVAADRPPVLAARRVAPSRASSDIDLLPIRGDRSAA